MSHYWVRLFVINFYVVIYIWVYPSLHTVKTIRKRLNSEVDVVQVENGAYRPFKETLSLFLKHIVSAKDNTA